MLEAVAEAGSTTATRVADTLPVSRQAVVKHLRALADAGLVTGERHGREQRFHLTPEPLGDAVAWMASVGAAWDQRFERLRRNVAARERRH